VSVLTTLKPKSANGNGAGRTQNWLSPLNLHWAGVGLLALVCVYLLAQMALLWHDESNYNADAIAQQKVELKTAQIAAMPLRGLDEKVAIATAQADRFYRERLPGADSEMLTEIGALTKKAGVRLTGVQYPQEPVLAGSAGELMEERIDARLSGDYRPLVQFINSLERDKMFFVITGLTLTGQQTGTVNLRLRLTTYVRGNATQSTGAGDGAGKENALAAAAPDGGAR
jgi:type IV pilus assembly protein PilO